MKTTAISILYYFLFHFSFGPGVGHFERVRHPPLPDAAATYNADIPLGFIGTDKTNPVDDPYDNIFHVTLPNQPGADSEVRLTYRLKGVQDHTALARSINDQPSAGGYLINKTDIWTTQTEILEASWLRQGDNVIRFKTPETVDIRAEIRDVRLVVAPKNKTGSKLAVDLPDNRFYGNMAYLKGRLDQGATLFIEGKQVTVEQGGFEWLGEQGPDSGDQWNLHLKAVLADGETISRMITLERQPAADYALPLSAKGRITAGRFEVDRANKLQTAGASISVSHRAMCTDALIAIAPLRAIDLPPLGADLINVTRYNQGYRFLPDGTTFNEAADLEIAYDPALIPDGYSASDIQTFYFDETARKWVALPKDSLLDKTYKLRSETTHFTDFINGIIRVPESPQTQGFTPTSMQGMETADPSAGIVPVEPPAANNMGTANLHFPIKLPDGRKGMGPDLSIDYNSEIANSWLGLGWNLEIPSIGVETRWGVPRFLAGKETETYLFNGDQLTPVAHRGILKDRAGNEKIFHPRVEGQFSKIVRHGSTPKDYWWEVTDKTGARQFYGGLPGQGPLPDAVLRDRNGNIAFWALVETRDLDDNFIRYEYHAVLDPGVPGGNVPGQQLYPDRITYTGYGTENGKYSVTFIRDRQLGEPKRPDIEIDARLGFKQVTADLLRKIEVRFKENLIRTYELTYTQGAFYKTLLKSIAEIDKEGKEFYRNEMDYFDDIRQQGAYQPYGTTVNLPVRDDHVEGEILTPFPWTNGETSVLGGSKSSSFSAGLAVTVGPLGNPFAKTNTAGGNYNYGESSSQGLISFVDITGDGLPDKVYAGPNGGLVYRPNLGIPYPADQLFGAEAPLNMNQFEQSKTVSNSVGAEAHPGIAFVGYTYTDAKTNTPIYFIDLNGDGLIDIANNEKGYFSFITENGQGHPAFSTLSTDTPSPIVEGALTDVAPPPPTPEELDSLIDEFPLHDLVRMWQAPCDGIVSLNAPVQLIEDTSPAGQAYSKKDGVTVSIQFKQNVLWKQTIAPDNFQPVSPTVNAVSNIQVKKGERFYFRLQSINNGLYDQVKWDPEITYSTIDAGYVDADGRRVFRYKASEDYVLASRQIASMPFDGVIRVKGGFQKPVTSDSITLQAFKGNQVIWSKTYDWNETADEDIDLDGMPVSVVANQEVMFRVYCATNIDWAAISWKPMIYYESTTNGQPVNGLDFMPAVEFTMFNNPVTKTPVWHAADSITFDLMPNIVLSPVPPAVKTFDITLSVKGVNKLYGETTFTYSQGNLNGVTPISLTIPKGDSVYFEYFIQDDLIADDDFNADLTVDTARVTWTLNGTPGFAAAGVFAQTPEKDVIFGPLYRGWGQFAYNGNRDRADLPINEADLKLDEYMVDEDIEDIENPDDISGQFDVKTTKFIILIADPKSGAWMGYDNLTYLNGMVMSSSRLGEDDITGSSFVSVGTDCKYAPVKVSKSSTHSFTGGAYISGGYTESTTTSVTDFVDMNGDRYPDIVHPNRIIYTNQRGGLDESVPYSLGNHTATSYAIGAGIAGNPGNSNTSNSGNGAGVGSNRSSVRSKAGSGRLDYNSKEATESASSMVGFSGNINVDNDRAEHSWMDINGDGLPDKVFRNGNVALNMGYWFAPAEPWGFQEIRGGQSMDFGAGLGVNLFNGSFEAGTSSSLTINMSTTGMQDVNGDGLVDLIIAQNLAEQTLHNITKNAIEGLIPKENIRVRLNTGNGFGPPIEWPGVSTLDEGSSSAESVNFAITGCIPILVVRICFNPSTSAGRAVSRQKSQFNDLDGDGYPDFLQSENDGNLSAKFSTIGRTNMLKRVQRPLGASFDIDYALTGNSYDLPFGKWTMSSLEIEDGLAGDGADRMKYAFSYEDGVYDRHERTFNGFRTVKTQELDTGNGNQAYRLQTETYYNRNYYNKGLIKSESTSDADENKYSETLYTYEFRDINTAEILPSGFEKSDSGTVFPALVQTQHFYYEGQADPGLTTQSTYDYDPLGNLIKYTDTGDGTPEDQLIAHIDYHHKPNLYLHAVPASITVETAEGEVRKRESSIDDSGNITRIRSLLEDGSAAQTDLTYDDYGNLTRVLRPANAKGERLSFDYTLDDEVHTYVVNTLDGYGYSSSAAYDYEFGQLLRSTDLKEQEMAFAIDARGRVTAMTGPYELAAGKPYTIAYEYHPEATVPYALTRHYDPEHDSDIDTWSFIDGLMRPVQVKKTGALFAGAGADDQPVTIVSGRVAFDAFGRITKTWYPTTEPPGQEAQFNPGYDNTAPTVSTFDVMDRELTVTLPDGAKVDNAYGFGVDRTGYTGFKTATTDPLGHLRETITDVKGRTRETADYSDNGPILTGYRYNALSELLKVLDTDENETVYRYDHLGRQISADQPDGGLTEFTYDHAGNLTGKVTANIRSEIPGGAILYGYDKERLTTIDYPKQYQNKVQLHYGEPGAKHFRAGEVWLIEDAGGGREFFFDPLGETIKTIRTIMTSEGNVRTFVSEAGYDTWGRIQTMTYPDGEKVDYAYNRAGKLRSMKSVKGQDNYSIVKQLGYDRFEDRVFSLYGNGVATRCEYDTQRRWLSSMQVQTPSGRKFIDNQYTYDAVSNLLRLENKAPSAADKPGGPATQTYTYDPLYRLTSAEGTWQGATTTSAYSLNMAYDQLNNILSKQQTRTYNGTEDKAASYSNDYWYDGDLPHAATGIGNRELRYDANGNMKSWADADDHKEGAIIWDEENRMAGISNDGYISQYTYDAGGERTVKSHRSGRGVFVNGAPVGASAVNHNSNYTAYVSPYLVVNETNFTKHYYIGDERVLSRIGTGEFNNDYWYFRGITAGNKNYVLRMQLLQKAYWEYIQQLGIPPGPPTLPHNVYPIPVPDSLANYDNTIPSGWPQPVPIDPNGPPGPPTLQQYTTLDNDSVTAGYGFTGTGAPKEINQFYYHSDQVGSAAYVTDLNGEVRQHQEYTPFGETFADEHAYTETQPYLFNAKELDAETGLYYYGARYYDPKSSIWLGVDPMAEDMPSWSPYAFSFYNPVTFMDPDGNMPGDQFASADAAATDFGTNYNGKYILRKKPYTGKVYRLGNGQYTYKITPKGGRLSNRNAVADLKTGRSSSGPTRRPRYNTSANGTLVRTTPGWLWNWKRTLSRNMPSDPKRADRLNRISPFGTNEQDTEKIKGNWRNFKVEDNGKSVKRQFIDNTIDNLGVDRKKVNRQFRYNPVNNPTTEARPENRRRSNNLRVRFRIRENGRK